MKKLIFFSIIMSVLVLSYNGIAQLNVKSNQELFKPLPPDFKDRLIDDPTIEDFPDVKKEKGNQFLAEQGNFLLNSKDLPFECEYKRFSPIFLYSKRINSAVDISTRFMCESKNYYVKLNYYIFEDAEKARLGANEKFNGLAVKPHEDQVNRTFTGKKFGDICILNGDPESGYLALTILYNKFFIIISIDSKDQLDPKLLDQWAEAVLNKIKKGIGEVE